MSEIQPEDLIKFGLIPEFVGRLPVVGMLEDLDEFALIEILTRPKNAIVKQYQRLFEFENVRLKFTDEALRAIARQAMARKVGARGLRMILEELMLDLMFNLPSQKKAERVRSHAGNGGEAQRLVRHGNGKSRIGSSLAWSVVGEHCSWPELCRQVQCCNERPATNPVQPTKA